jgi:serine O-acetyltransferase
MPERNILKRVVSEIRCDIASARERDPSARGVGAPQLLATWPGIQALLAHRVAHALDQAGVPALPRAIAFAARAVTGIEIHPAASIGDGLFIDHGSGVVIGETAVIGNDVTLYQGVTLGGIGSGAKLLGPITVGHGAKIGANSVVVIDVPENATVVGVPGHPVRVDGKRVEGPDADWIHLPDPVADAMRALSARVAELERELSELTGQPRATDRESATVLPLRPVQGRNPAGG